MAAVVTIMGPIGSGKTLQAEMVASRLGWQTFSTGQLLRDDHTQTVQHHLDEGSLAPSEYVQELVMNKIRTIDANTGVVLDGSPRKITEAQYYEQQLPLIGRKLDLVIFLEVDLEEVKQRLAARGRADDNVHTISVRWRHYEQDTLPTVHHLEQQGIAIARISGVGEPDEVQQRVMAALKEAKLV